MPAILRNVDRDDTVLSTVAFTDDDGVAVDPDVVEFHIMNPTGAASHSVYVFGTDTEVENPEVGTFTFKFGAFISGNWLLRCVGVDGDGNSQVASGQVVVNYDPFP